METALISSTVGILLSKLNTMIEEDRKLRKALKVSLRDIKYEMEMMVAAIQQHEESNDRRPVVEKWIGEVKELAYNIEDCIDFFIDTVTCSPEAGWLHQKYHHAVTKGIRTKFARDIQGLKNEAREANERRKRYMADAAPAEAASEPWPSMSIPYTPEDELVGIEEPKQELLDLLEAAAEGKRRVISIVGFRGIGKTTIAKVVFDSLDDDERFPCRAWVVASERKDAMDLLVDIFSKLRRGAEETTSSSTLEQLGRNLSTYLQRQQRYLIVIDDMRTEVLWENIKSSFPINTNGRIIVTTSIQSVARTCSSHGGHVYKMQPLNDDNSKTLLQKKVFGSHTSSSPDFEGSESILKKCDGLPLALVNIAQLLNPCSEQLTRDYCNKVCRDLGCNMQSKDAPSSMKQVLIQSYKNLPGYDLKTCLLSVSIFPKNHRIKRKSLVRRWLAEGFVVKDGRNNNEDVAHGYFEELINRSIIQPVEISNNARVKTCRLHGIMLDFIVHKSLSDNFLTLIHNDELIPNMESNHAVRRLSLHNNSAESSATVNVDLSHIRSLTIFGHVGVLLNFRKCKLLRVLDLENCKELKDRDLQDICKLLQLKYLSLRGTDVSMLPREISNLHYLDTLDMRGPNTKMLPMEVLYLPRLAHLFGRFKLPCQLNKVGNGHKLLTFFSHNSKLQTLAGFVMDENHGFQQMMIHISTLRKVKIWSQGTPSSQSIDLLVSSLQERFCGLQSLSIDFGDHSIDFLDSLKPPCVLTSVKLHGRLTKLPDFIERLADLELHLLSTALSSEGLLALQSLGCLLYLKLVEDCPEFVDGSFNFQSNGFPKLQRLCIQAPKLPNLSIEEGAMQRLTSLQLICEDISGFPLDDIRHLSGLKEVSLATTVADARKAWKAAAKKHKNRPAIYVV